MVLFTIVHVWSQNTSTEGSYVFRFALSDSGRENHHNSTVLDFDVQTRGIFKAKLT